MRPCKTWLGSSSAYPHWCIAILGLGFLILYSWAEPLQATQEDQCEVMKSQQQLLYQQFKASKICKESAIAKGWTDCVFKAGSTEILLAGAIGMDPTALMAGTLGSGFWILSVDPEVTVRVLIHEKLGMLVRVDAKSNLQDTGCLYNEAFITLEARVLSPGEINILASPPPAATKNPSEQAKIRIKNAQEALIVLGYKLGPPDGVLGPATRAAMKVYRQDKGIRADITDERLFELLSLEAIMQSLERATKEVEQLKS